MTDKNTEYLKLIEKYSDITPMVLSSQIRYNNRVRIKDEDLAQHSYYVAYDIIRLGYDYKIPQSIIGEAVCRALVHDYDEQYTSDIPHNCKVEFPELKDMVQEIGFNYMKSQNPAVYQYFKDYLEKDDLANLLVDLGDAISVAQYVSREKQLGNSTEAMEQIHIEITERLLILFDKLYNTLSKTELA